MKSQENYGFTLIETLLVLLMMGIGIVVLTNMFISHNRLYRSQSAELDITSSVRSVLDDIDNNVRPAHRTLGSYGAYTASSTTLILQVQAVDPSDILISNTWDYVVYHISGTSLIREIIADPSSSRVSSTRTLASNVSSITFTYNNANYDLVTQVTTSLTSAESTGIQNRTYTGTTKSILRSY